MRQTVSSGGGAPQLHSSSAPACLVTPFHPPGWHGRWLAGYQHVRSDGEMVIFAPQIIPHSTLNTFLYQPELFISNLSSVVFTLHINPALAPYRNLIEYQYAQFNMCLAWNPKLPYNGRDDISPSQVYFMTSPCCYSTATAISSPPFPRFYFG